MTMKAQIKYSVIVTLLLGTGGSLLALMNNAYTVTPAPAILPVVKQPASIMVAPVVVPVPDNPGLLDARRRLALSMIESGNDDREIGGAGEVSRYQIMPSVWRHYSTSRSYHAPDIALEVAQQHWSVLHASFKQKARREPNDFDMYVLWNTRYGYYARRGFNPARLSPVVRDRAQRFVNLIEDSTTDSGKGRDSASGNAGKIGDGRKG